MQTNLQCLGTCVARSGEISPSGFSERKECLNGAGVHPAAAFMHERAIQTLMTGGIAERSVQSVAKNDRLIKDQRVIQYRKRLRQCLTIKPFVKVDKVLDWNNGRFLVVLAFMRQ